MPTTASAQHPGHLGKPPPTHVGKAHKRVKLGALPRWPNKADPKPMRTKQYLRLKVQLKGSKLKVLHIAKKTFPAGPTLIQRFRGRFEVRLYSHGLLRDVVRFDLPLTGAAENKKGPKRNDGSLGDRLGLGLAKGVTATVSVRVPFDDRITRAVINDVVAKKTTKVDLSSVLPPKPKPKLPANLRTRGIGKASPGSLHDCLVLFKGKPKKIKDCEKGVRKRKRARKKKHQKKLEEEKILKP